MTTVVPIRSMTPRAPEQGRLRYGVKTDRAMKAIDRWRVTSPDREPIEQLAAIYGGKARPWSDAKANPRDQWEVLTESSEIQVWLPPNPFSLQMERWGGKGLERRCDGETCVVQRMNQSCLCEREGKLTCKPYSRVNVILPEVVLGGVWRLEVKGKNFAYEAPGMIEMLAGLQTQGLVKVKLRLTHRQRMTEDGLKKYIVPQFVADSSPQQILDGAARVSALGIAAAAHPSAGELGPASKVDDDVWHTPEEDPEVDTELLDLLSASVVEIRSRQAERDAEDIEDAEIIEDGWDIPPPNVSVRRNPDKNGRKWIRK